MGILDRLFGALATKATKNSDGLFNQAVQHWEVMKAALFEGNGDRAQSALLEVVRLCQEAIAADPQKAGDAYVLLTNALLKASQVYTTGDEQLLTKYSAACIYFWWTLPHKEWPITLRNNYQTGLRWYQEVLQRLEQAGSTNPASAMAECGSLYGKLITSPAGFEGVETALMRITPDAEVPKADGEILGKIAYFESRAEKDPEDPIPWGILAVSYEQLGRYRDTERALQMGARLEKLKYPNIKTADYLATSELGTLYTAALSSSIRGKGLAVWGNRVSEVTPEALGYTFEQTRELAQQHLSRAWHVARDTGLASLGTLKLKLALEAANTLAISDFESYDELVEGLQ